MDLKNRKMDFKDLSFNDVPMAIGEIMAMVKSIQSKLDGLGTKQQDGSQSPDELLTVQQAAALLNLKKPTMYGYSHKAGIPVCKVGKRLYFPKQSLIDWVKQGNKKTLEQTSCEADNYLTAKKKQAFGKAAYLPQTGRWVN